MSLLAIVLLNTAAHLNPEVASLNSSGVLNDRHPIAVYTAMGLCGLFAVINFRRAYKSVED
jgi:hypothetical protein